MMASRQSQGTQTPDIYRRLFTKTTVEKTSFPEKYHTTTTHQSVPITNLTQSRSDMGASCPRPSDVYLKLE